MLKKIFMFPVKHLVLVIPAVLTIGFLTGSYFDTSFLKNFILPATFMMIYPTMIGFRLKEAVDLSHNRVVLTSLAVNFLLVPLLAYLLGNTFLLNHPQLFAGLALASLLPTSGMTISWTMLNRGNVPAAVKITVLGLLLGSLLAPWYLLFMVGKYVPVDIWKTFQIIAALIFLPLVLGNITYRFLMKRYPPAVFKKDIKPLLPGISVCFMLFIVFSSMSMKAKKIFSQPDLLLQSVVVIVLFYLGVFIISTIWGRIFLDRENSITLVYSTAMRNLSSCLGLALATFGAEAALLITLAFIVQVQAAAWYGKLEQRFNFFRESSRAPLAPRHH
ncbi:arsenic resistance protein [Calderihabitans maritimus]|uniref:Bile acid:sodium symporter n=1 Tax=Calderihabitans maritimus TaxID=1246530 RepID=A0A1Z5HNU8_9FIRM|nr:bile acid:sodium symporter [Calderihabitans maritimus]GAW90975.1 bile acid:sodium symporter [Calderihabitans maritimus]